MKILTEENKRREVYGLFDGECNTKFNLLITPCIYFYLCDNLRNCSKIGTLEESLTVKAKELILW